MKSFVSALVFAVVPRFASRWCSTHPAAKLGYLYDERRQGAIPAII
jgi:hypothetical protein